MNEQVSSSNGASGERVETRSEPGAGKDTGTTTLDALVIGAGVAGLYQLHQLREQGLRVRACDSATGVGCTWYWNRYPGAKFDSESYVYQYLLSEDLYKGWQWSSLFPEQPEIEAWMNYAADALDLKKDIQSGTTVTQALYNEQSRHWKVITDKAETIDTQFLVTCCGMLSAPLSDMFPGQDEFHGPIFHTSRWLREPVELAGKRVVGIGATGIQVIQTIADQVGELKVFVRTPHYVLPLKNPSYGPEEVQACYDRFEELSQTLPNKFTGFEYDFDVAWADLTPEQRRARLEDIHANGSLKLWLFSFAEMFFDESVSEEISEFVQVKMRERLVDPELCRLLIPTDYGLGTHRVPLETRYLEVYHQPSVEAIPVKDNPIERVTTSGIRLSDRTEYDLDVIIPATGLDAGTGASTRIDIRGRAGRSLKEEWGRNICTTMGLQVHGYPNLFTTAVPLAPSAALCNMTTCLQQQTEWTSNCIRFLHGHDHSVIEPTAETEELWVQHHDETAGATLISKTDSWSPGFNVPGKPRRVLSHCGGTGTYLQKCDEVARNDYQGFSVQ